MKPTPAFDRAVAATAAAAAQVPQTARDRITAYARDNPGGRDGHRGVQLANGTSDRSKSIERLCALYGADVLVPELKKSGLSVAAIGAMLQRAVGRAAKMTPAGIETFRLNAMTATIWKDRK